jgi:uncharacterized membrane protein
MLLWPGLKVPAAPTLLALDIAPALRVPENVRSFLTFAAIVPFAVAALASVRLYRGAALPAATAALYAAAATAPLLLALVIAYLRVTQFDSSIPFALCGAALACLFAVAADRFQPGEGEAAPAALRVAAGAFAAAGIAALSFALVAGLERGYMTVAFALAALGTAFVATLKNIPLLRYATTALGLVVLGRVAWDPRIMGEEVGRWPVLNWLLFGYGVPGAAFAISGAILRRNGEDLAVRLADALAVLFAALLVFFQIRHLLNAGDPLAKSSSHVEQGLFVMTSLAFAFVLTRLGLAHANPVFRVASLAFGVISAAFVAFGLGLGQNPLFTGEQIHGAPVFSSLMLAYLLPGLMAAVIARASQGVRPAWYETGVRVLALALVFGYVTLEVRHIYQGDTIRLLQHTVDAEQWTYSVAWLLLGLVLLAYGVWRTSREARLASGALVLLSVLKVFLLDLEGLTGLWRALSFISLGLVLIGIGLVYQKLIFAKPKMPSVPST